MGVEGAPFVAAAVVEILEAPCFHWEGIGARTAPVLLRYGHRPDDGADMTLKRLCEEVHRDWDGMRLPVVQLHRGHVAVQLPWPLPRIET